MPAAEERGVRHVLKVSMPDTLEDYYALGRYDDAAGTFVAEDGDDYRRWRRLDHGHVYASKTFFDARRKRRVMWAWVNESDSEADDVAKGWSGLQSFPRALWLDSSGSGKVPQLVQWPVEEIETLRTKRAVLPGAAEVVASGGVREIDGIVSSQADVDVVFEVPDLDAAEEDFGFDPKRLLDPDALCREKSASVRGGVGPSGLLVMASGERTAVFFRVLRLRHEHVVLMCTDLTRYYWASNIFGPHLALTWDTDGAAPKYTPICDEPLQGQECTSRRTEGW
jgi:hypothetical protein